MKIVETDRLILRWVTIEDSEFMYELLNDPSWLKFISSSGPKTLDDARDYILNKMIAVYERLGFGLYLVELKSGGIPIGICGLVRRESLENVDIGFAYLPEFRANGYAFEAATAVMDYGKSVLGFKRIVAITSPDNYRSARLLEKLGFKFERMIKLSEIGQEDMLFASDD